MRTLITNDDGIDSPGLHALAEVAVAAGLDVTVAAPHEDTSGTSASLSALEAGGRLRLQRRELAGLPGVRALAAHASPAMIVFAAARGAFGDPPELVLSGINRGPNLGQAVLHSGTVGAALTAASHGLFSLAVSLAVTSADSTDARHVHELGAGEFRAAAGGPYWESAASITARVLAWLQSADAPREPRVLNINAPNIPADQVRGLRAATLAAYGAVQAQVGERGDDYVTLSFAVVEAQPQPGTDAALLADGWATVTPLRTTAEQVDLVLPRF